MDNINKDKVELFIITTVHTQVYGKMINSKVKASGHQSKEISILGISLQDSNQEEENRFSKKVIDIMAITLTTSLKDMVIKKIFRNIYMVKWSQLQRLV